MQTLWDECKNCFNEGSDLWNYYNVSFGNPFGNNQASINFIKDFFKAGGKEIAIEMDWMDTEVKRRSTHSIYVYFLGLLLYRAIGEKLEIKSEYGENYDFSYLWYIVCLAHDYGYEYEVKQISEIKLDSWCRYYLNYLENNIKSANCELKRFGLFRPNRDLFYKFMGYDITGYDTCETTQMLMMNGGNQYTRKQLMLNEEIEYTNGLKVKSGIYTKEIKNRYFQYRLYHFNCIDHGIIGADKLYNGLVKNYCSKFKQCQEPVDFNNFVFNNLHFCVEQFKIFRYISDCIASHNIWYASDRSSKMFYVNFGLNSLLYKKNRKISYEKNPLFFLLCLADSLEPVKRGNESDAQQILEQIKVDYCHISKIVKITIRSNWSNSERGKQYIRNVKELTTWLDIKIECINWETGAMI